MIKPVRTWLPCEHGFDGMPLVGPPTKKEGFIMQISQMNIMIKTAIVSLIQDLISFTIRESDTHLLYPNMPIKPSTFQHT